jgi:phosphocarrier protein FPr/phosphocarrier protein
MAASTAVSVHLDLLAPLSGVLVPLESVPDPVFAGRMVGDGISIDPTSAELLAPVAGTVTQLHRAHHAVAITSDSGVEILLHIGLDTVELKGEGFTPKVALGDRVRAGQVLIAFDPVLLGRRARSLLTEMVIPDGARVGSMQRATGLVVAGQDRVLQLLLREPPLPGAAAPAPALAATPAVAPTRVPVAGASPAGAAPAGEALAGVRSDPVVLHNRSGLHARPAAILAAEAKKFSSTIRLVRGTAEVNAKSVLAILGFGVQDGDTLQVYATGADAQKAVTALVTLLTRGGEATGAAPVGGGQAPDSPVAVPQVAAGPASIAPDPAPADPAPADPARAVAHGAGERAGVAASPGLAVGQVYQFRPQVLAVVEAGGDPAQERAHLEAALQDAGGQLEAIKHRIRSVDPTRADILSAHQELLADPDLAAEAERGITAGQSAAFAWRAAFTSHATKVGGLDSPLLRERANDIRDVGRRVLALLTGTTAAGLNPPRGSILIADTLSPSEAAQLDRTQVLGLCTTTGGPTGHVAILARSLGIPAIVGIDATALDLAAGTVVVLDGSTGILQGQPTPADLAAARERLGQQQAQRVREQAAAQKPAVTADGFAMEVSANIRSAQEAREAVAAGAEGIGLLRSEFLFLNRESPPSEDEQAAEYGTVARILGPGRKLVVRTLDVGGDKPLGYLPLPHEANPFLGMRGLRVSLERPDLFRTQLRAILRAVPLGDLHIMFPMVATLEELRAAKAILGEEVQSLGRSARLGVMIEVPSAALIAEALAPEIDFFSIGTNDLTQYCMAMDRGHPQLARQADALHPSVLKLIGFTVEAAHRHGKWVGVCGGLASEVLALPALLGLGVDELSVSVPVIGAVKARLAHLHKAQCQALALELLQLSTAGEVRERLAAWPE